MDETNIYQMQPVTAMPVNRVLPKWATGKLVLGIISMVFFVIVSFQSCAAGLLNVFSSESDSSGSFGFLVAINLLATGIIAVASRRSSKKAPMIIAGVLLWLNYFYGKMFCGRFTDLRIWGFVSFAFGVVYLFSIATSKKDNIIIAIASAVYLIIALL